MLSTVILTRNEERNLERCLKSVAFSDEIIVLDDRSTDKTAEIARKYKAVVHSYSLNGDFAAARNAALEKTQGDWILYLDADEQVSQSLKQAIMKTIKHAHETAAYRLKRQDVFWGTHLRYGEVRKAYKQGIIRLVRRGSGLWQGKVHEEYITEQPVSVLEGLLHHYPHQTIKEFIKDINVYSTIRARELFEKGTKVSSFQIVAYPFAKFVLTYVFYRGFLDGAAGFAYSFFMSFHSFLVRSKLYQYRTFS